MNDIDKAFEKLLGYSKPKSKHRNETSQERQHREYYEDGLHFFTAGAEYGEKQVRIKALEEIKWKCLGSPDRNIRKWVDTKLENLRSE